MVSTKFYYNVRDIQEQLFTGVVAAVCRCSTKQVLSKSSQYSHEIFTVFNKHFYKEIPTQMFPCKFCKIFKNNFFIEHLRWLLLQFLQIKDLPKNFAKFNIMYRYWSPFLSSCRPITCNFVKIEVQVFYCELCEISQNNFMQKNFERLLLDDKRCCWK